MVEVLEGRQLLTASLQPISNLTVPTKQGFTQPLLASATAMDAQTFTVTSSNPDIVASIMQGQFWSINVSYTDPNNAMNDFSGTLTSQLFDSYRVDGTGPPVALTGGPVPPTNTINQITQYTNDNYYTTPTMLPTPPLPQKTNPTKTFTRIIGGFPNATNFVAQGGGPTIFGTGSSGQMGTPFNNQNFQQIPFTGVDQLALANAGINTNDTQFFFTTGSPNSELGYNYTIFGQLVTGLATLAKMTQVPVTTNPASGEDSLPVNPISITAVSLAPTNPNGVLLLDATQATQGEKATITVTATDSVDHTTASESFTVTVGAYTGPTSSSLIQTINFKPFATAQTVTTTLNTAASVQLQGQTGSPVAGSPGTLSFSLVSQPTHGTITNFNAATGTLTYTPTMGYAGPDSFAYKVTATGPNASAPSATSNPATVSIAVGPVKTGAVTVVGTVLLVTPVPRTDKGTNTIDITEIPNPSGSGDLIQVTVNGVIDQTQPPTTGTGAVDRIGVFGGKRANNILFIDPSVTLPVTMEGGRAGRNKLTGGGGESREHGWFGYTTLIGGPGRNQLNGLKGRVRFKPSKATNLIFAGVPRRRTSQLHAVAPGGTFYKFVHGHIVPIPTPNTFIKFPKLRKLV
jgi:cyclophilin family peptidyl-prolyl cis-trans isomerase